MIPPKAFDNHSTLLRKLENEFNFRPKTLALFASYSADQHGRATREARENQKRLAATTEHYTQRYIRVWNELTQELRAPGSLSTFKGLLKAHLIAKQSST